MAERLSKKTEKFKSMRRTSIGVLILAALLALPVAIVLNDVYPSAPACGEPPNPDSTILVSGWGFAPSNRRHIDARTAGLTKADIPRLKLKWAFRYPWLANKARSQPAVTGDTLYVGSQRGSVYALATDSGCVRWRYNAGAEVRTAITLGEVNDRRLLFFGDFFGHVHAVDAITGERIWRTEVDDHLLATITGSPVLHEDRLYVPVSSFEVAVAGFPLYPCCTFRGAVAAVDAESGETIWKTYMAGQPARTARNTLYVPQYAPSGVPIWGAPTIDPKRNRLYVGTGENYTKPATASSDAIIALDLDSGAIVWLRQFTTDDAWNFGCVLPGAINCPEDPGMDLDFGASPMLVSLNGRDDVIVAGQKSGMVYGLDPDRKGRVIWQRRLGRGGALGGIHWGMAADESRVFIPNSDYLDEIPGLRAPSPPMPDMPPQPALTALDPRDGQVIWKTPISPQCTHTAECDPGLSAAATAMPGVIFAASLDGRLLAFDSDTGKPIWSANTAVTVISTDGKYATGGSIDADGPVVAGGQLYINSGYALFGAKGGNVLLAFSVDGH